MANNIADIFRRVVLTGERSPPIMPGQEPVKDWWQAQQNSRDKRKELPVGPDYFDQGMIRKD